PPRGRARARATARARDRVRRRSGTVEGHPRHLRDPAPASARATAPPGGGRLDAALPRTAAEGGVQRRGRGPLALSAGYNCHMRPRTIVVAVALLAAAEGCV